MVPNMDFILLMLVFDLYVIGYPRLGALSTSVFLAHMDSESLL